MLNKAKAITTVPVVDITRATEFYEKTLGFKLVDSNMSGRQFPDAMFKAGGDTRIYLYQRDATKADHTIVSFEVDDIEKSVKDLRGKGVVFGEYNTPAVKTVNSIATLGKVKTAWFADTEGNLLAISEWK